jgi:hypothetical protein
MMCELDKRFVFVKGILGLVVLQQQYDKLGLNTQVGIQLLLIFSSVILFSITHFLA